MPGVMFDRRMAANVKGKIFKTVVRPAMMYGLMTATLTETGGRAGGVRVEDAEIFHWDKIRNDYIRGTPQV